MKKSFRSESLSSESLGSESLSSESLASESLGSESLGSERICVVGLGFVGLPLAKAFAAHFPTIGYDSHPHRLALLKQKEELPLTSSIQTAADCTVYIVTVPTPIQDDNLPDLAPLQDAMRAVGSVLSRGDLVILESTVYPGVTEDICGPHLAEASGLVFNTDFHCGYSPERISPGQGGPALEDIVKVTSGSTPQAAQRVDALYRKIIRAGTHPVASLKIAEACKVVENVQRDVNIALVNELAVMFDSMGISTQAVLEAAGTKWNFLPFVPGLVGGHCISVDPYYLLVCQSREQPDIILEARKINDSIPQFLVSKIRALAHQQNKDMQGLRVLVLGFTFKENCADVRDTRVFPLVEGLRAEGCQVEVCDPVAPPEQAKELYNMELSTSLEESLAGCYDVVVFAVAHQVFKEIPSARLGKALVVDIKGIAPHAHWRL